MISRFTRHLAFLAPAAALAAWGTVMLHTVATGRIHYLLSPLFRNYVVAAGIALLILSVLYLLFYQPGPGTTQAASMPAWPRLRATVRWFFLIMPPLAACAFSPDALSSTTLANRAGSTSMMGAAPMPTWSTAGNDNLQAALSADPNQPIPMEITDLVTVGRTPAQIKSFSDRAVRVVGLIGKNGNGSTKLVRWMMWCCAADAQPISVNLNGNTAGTWKDGDWVEIVGAARFPSTLGNVTPQIDVTNIQATKEPDEPYLSP